MTGSTYVSQRCKPFRRIIAFTLTACLAVFGAVLASADNSAYAANSSLTVGSISTQAAKFAPTLKQASGNRSISVDGYLNVQGVGFDTYTKKDGYSFVEGTDGNSNFKLVHFTMNANGAIKYANSLKYAKKNLGHANDATVYKQAGKKYLFVAISGGTEFASKASNGKKTKIAVINLADYNKGNAKVYQCNIKVKSGVRMIRTVAKSAFSGISYTGTRKVDGKKRPVFVLKDGLQIYAAYATLSGKTFTLTIFDRARVDKPTIKYNGKKYESTFQGITYHNGYIYFPCSGETKKFLNNSFVIGRISYAKLFKGATKLQTCSKRITKCQGEALSCHIPESIFFRTLNSKDNMYLSINRATTASVASDIDAVLRSTQKY